MVVQSLTSVLDTDGATRMFVKSNFKEKFYLATVEKTKNIGSDAQSCLKNGYGPPE